MKGKIIVSEARTVPLYPRPKLAPRALLVAFLCLIGCGATLRAEDDAGGAELELACVDGATCRASLQRAEEANSDCLLLCTAEELALDAARGRLKSALEAEAQAAFDRGALERRRLTQMQNDRRMEQEAQRARHAAAEREREHQRKLELLAAEAEQLSTRAEQAQLERTAYFRALTPAQRLGRLKSCHAGALECDTLAGLLAAAAASPREQRLLIDEHERAFARLVEGRAHLLDAAYSNVQAAAYRTADGRPSPPDGALAQTAEAAAAPAQCCDGTMALGCDCAADDSEACCTGHGGSCGCVGDGRIH